MKELIWRRNGWKVIASVVALLIAASLMNGCSTTAGIEAAGMMVKNPEGASPLTKGVAVNNATLGRSVEVFDLKAAKAGNLMTAQVSLRSKERDTLPLQYKFVWFDALGVEIAANTGWKPLIIYGKETKTVQAVAPDPRARDFRLKLREPDHE